MNDASAAPPRKKKHPVVAGALIALGLLAVWIVVAGAYQVIEAALWPTGQPTQLSCRQGARALLGRLEGARAHAQERQLTERQALATFRGDLQPLWSEAPSIARKCRSEKDTEALVALRSLELLRYAEERAIRMSAVDLTKLRRRAPFLIQALEEPAPSSRTEP